MEQPLTFQYGALKNRGFDATIPDIDNYVTQGFRLMDETIPKKMKLKDFAKKAFPQPHLQGLKTVWQAFANLPIRAFDIL